MKQFLFASDVFPRINKQPQNNFQQHQNSSFIKPVEANIKGIGLNSQSKVINSNGVQVAEGNLTMGLNKIQNLNDKNLTNNPHNLPGIPMNSNDALSSSAINSIKNSEEIINDDYLKGDITSNKEVKIAEENITKYLEEFIKKNENNYNAQKIDLVNFINETLSKNNDSLKSHLEQLITTQQPIHNPRDINLYYKDNYPNIRDNYLNLPLSYINPQCPTNFQQPQQKVETPVTIVNEEKKKSRGKYYKLPANIWSTIITQYPDLPNTLFDSAYIKDEENYIKMKNNYIKIDNTGVARILNNLNKK